MAELAVATYNIRHGISDERRREDVLRLAQSGADIIGLQELGGNQNARAIENVRGFRNYRSKKAPGSDSTPIMWRANRFKLVDKGAYKISPRAKVGNQGAGPRVLQAKYVVWVRLKDVQTGRYINFLNCHLAPSVEGGGGEPVGDPDLSMRLRLYRQQMNGIKELVRNFRGKGLLFIVGDFNVNYKRDRVTKDRLFPYYNMGQVGLRSNWSYFDLPEKGTHRNRFIDYVFLRSSPKRLKIVSQHILRGYNSDHRPVLVKFLVSKGS